MDTIPLLPDFRDLLRFLSEEEVEYLVVGGMAVNVYGYHRSTGDLDVWVAVTLENEDRLARALRKFGFSDFHKSRRGSGVFTTRAAVPGELQAAKTRAFCRMYRQIQIAQ